VIRLKAQAAMEAQGFILSRDNRWFILAAQGYLALAGIGLLLNGSLLSDSPSRPAFLHLFTLGFLVMMIYGLGAHMLPRFTGNSIREGVWPWLQMALSHGGVAGYVIGYLAGWHGLTLTGAVLGWLGLAIFAYRVWPVLWGTPARS
jgi:hypothetical protein